MLVLKYCDYRCRIMRLKSSVEKILWMKRLRYTNEGCGRIHYALLHCMRFLDIILHGSCGKSLACDYNYGLLIVFLGIFNILYNFRIVYLSLIL